MEEKIDKKERVKVICSTFGKSLLYIAIYVFYQYVVTLAYGVWLGIKYSNLITNLDKEEYVNFINEKAASNQGLFILISVILTFLTFYIIFKKQKINIKEKLNIKNVKIKYAILIIFFGIGFNLITTALLNFTYFIPGLSEVFNEYEASSGGLLYNKILNIIPIIILAPIIEEIIFRGIVLQEFSKKISMWSAIIISSLMFGLFHGQIIWILYTMIVGIALAKTFIKYDSLIASIILHISYNATPYILLNIFNIDTNSVPEISQLLIILCIGIVLTILYIFISNKMIKKEKIKDLE